MRVKFETPPVGQDIGELYEKGLICSLAVLKFLSKKVYIC